MLDRYTHLMTISTYTFWVRCLLSNTHILKRSADTARIDQCGPQLSPVGVPWFQDSHKNILKQLELMETHCLKK